MFNGSFIFLSARRRIKENNLVLFSKTVDAISFEKITLFVKV